MQTIFGESFETDGNGTRYATSIPEFTDGSGDFFLRTDLGDVAGTYGVTGADGGFVFAAQDLDGEGAASQQALIFSGIDIDGFTDLAFGVLLAEDDASDGDEDYDLVDFVRFEYRIDGGAFRPLLAVESVPDGDAFNAVPAIDTDFDGDGDGTEITDVFQRFSSAIAGTGSTLDLRVTFDLDAGDEDIAIDALEITGTAVAERQVVAGEDFDGGATSLVSGFDPASGNRDGGGGDFFGVGSLADWPQPTGVPFGLADDSVADVSGGGAFAGDDEGVYGRNADVENDFFALSDSDEFGAEQTVSWTFDVSGFEDLRLAIDFGGIADGDDFGGYGPQTARFAYAVDGTTASTAFDLAATTDTGEFAYRPMDDGTVTPDQGVLAVGGDNAVTKRLAEDGAAADNTLLDKTPASGDGAGMLDTFVTDLDGTGSTLTLTLTADVPFEAFAFDNIEITGVPATADGTRVAIAAADATRAEGDAGTTEFTFTLTRSGDVSAAGTVDFAVSGDVDAADFGGALPSGTVRFAAGEAERTIALAVSGDTDFEADEALTVTLSNPSDGQTIATASATGSVLNDDVPPVTPISTVQGPAEASSLAGQTVTVEAIVTADFQDAADSDLGGFFLQEEASDGDGDDATSEGVFVFEGNASVAVPDLAVGDRVRLTGTVDEFQGETQIDEIAAIEVVPGGSIDAVEPGVVTFPAAVTTNAAGQLIADLEAVEGMLITVPETLTVGDLFTLGRYNEVGLTSGGRIQTFTQTNAPSAAGFEAFQQEAASRGIVIDDAFFDAQNRDPIFPQGGLDAEAPNVLRSGDTLTGLTGVVSYNQEIFGDTLFRVIPTEAPQFEQENPRPETPPVVGGSLKVASFNVLNYFTTIDTNPGGFNGPDITGPAGDQEPRGAEANGTDPDGRTEFERQQAKLVAAITEIDADVLGLIEIENNPDPNAALASLVDALNAAGPATYDFIAAGPIEGAQGGAVEGDAIKVGFLYDVDAVTPEGDVAILDETVDPRFQTVGTQRPALAQTFTETATGATFTAAVNHFKSKGSIADYDLSLDLQDAPAPGVYGPEQPDAALGDGQANNPTIREGAAEALVDWLATDPTGSGDPDFMILGDLNAYLQEDAIQAILDGADDTRGTDDDYLSLVGEDDYSFAFPVGLDTVPQVQTFGTLDYALVNRSLYDQVTGADIWHINADEPVALDYNLNFQSADQQDLLYAPDPFRSSDHDPVLVGLDLAPDDAPVIVQAPGQRVVRGTDEAEIFQLSGSAIVRPRGGEDTFDFAQVVENGRRDFLTLFGVEEDESVVGFDRGDVAFSAGAGRTLLVALDSGDFVVFRGIDDLDDLDIPVDETGLV